MCKFDFGSCRLLSGYAVFATLSLSIALGTAVARGAAFDEYVLSEQFTLPESAGVLDVLQDGRLVTLSGADVYAETAPASRSFAKQGTLPGADFSDYGAAFLRVSPDGARLAVGNGGGATYADYRVGVFDYATLSGSWFNAAHFDASWVDGTRLALTAGVFGDPSFVSVLDTTSTDPANPTNSQVIGNIGGASAGITFDASGNLYTGNGYTIGGPSGTGAVKYFDAASWTTALAAAEPIDFEANGTLIVDVLSAGSLGFDGEGNFFVGGGDFGGGEVDFAALVRSTAINGAVLGLGPADILDPSEVRLLDPDPNVDFNFYSVEFNGVTSELYVRDGTNVYAYTVPEPATAALVIIGAAVALRRRRLFRRGRHSGGGLRQTALDREAR